MTNILRIPKVQIALALLLIFISSLIHNPSLLPVRNLVFIVFAAMAAEFLFLKLRGIQFFFPSAAIVTGLIITLLTGPNLPIYDGVIAVFLAVASKNFVRFKSRHVFNPAGFGLLITALIFNHNVSWWAVSWQEFFPQSGISLRETIFFLILLSPSLVSMVRMRRFRITLSFLTAYTLINTIINGKLSIINFLLDPTVLFLSTVMLPEPMTTPNKPTRQILFGACIAFVSTYVLSILISNSLDPLIASLLIGNLLFFRFR